MRRFQAAASECSVSKEQKQREVMDMRSFFSRLFPIACILVMLTVSAAAQEESPVVVRVGVAIKSLELASTSARRFVKFLKNHYGVSETL